MKACTATLLLLFVCGVLSQTRPPFRQQNLYPYWADGFDTVWLDDMSFVTELHIQNYPPDNWTFFIYGSSTLRTIYPDGRNYYVGSTPNEGWHLPFIDFHTVQNGTDIWGFGPVDPFGLDDYRPTFGYELDIAVVTTKQGPGRYWRFSPLGYQGTFFTVRPLVFNLDIIGYFVGFWPNPHDPWVLHFGIIRARFNISADNGAPLPPGPPTFNQSNWIFDPQNDIAILENSTQFITYNAFFKPIVFHFWNVSGESNPNTTYTVVIDPGTRFVRTVIGSITPGTNLTVPPHLYWFPQREPNIPWNSGITSAAVYYAHSLLIFGLGVPGLGTGAIAFVHAYNLSTRAVISLPTNYSDPKALVVDEFNGTLYVAMNGGGAVLRIDIHTMNITGYQRTPPYLTRAWAGHDTPGHVYFVTNEQHSKVFRVSKHDFCPHQCAEFGYCWHGQCVCGPNFSETKNGCEWSPVVKDRNTIKKDQAGEAVLGVFFAIALIAAFAGWFLVWKSKRQGYQAV